MRHSFRVGPRRGGSPSRPHAGDSARSRPEAQAQFEPPQSPQRSLYKFVCQVLIVRTIKTVQVCV